MLRLALVVVLIGAVVADVVRLALL
jgi:hypothetical protein